MNTEKQNITVSRTTEKFVDCLKSTSNLYEQVHDALASMYCENTACEMINEQFHDTFEKMESIIEYFLVRSIKENIWIIGSTEI